MIEKILNKMNSLIPEDKLKHSFYGSLLFIGITFLSIFFFKGKICFIYGLLITALVAILKEIYDYNNKTKHTADIYDAIYTVLIPLLFTVLVLFY